MRQIIAAYWVAGFVAAGWMAGGHLGALGAETAKSIAGQLVPLPLQLPDPSLGIGSDREYFETREGKLIDAKGTVARYLRSYSRGSTQSALNVIQEIEVYGVPVP